MNTNELLKEQKEKLDYAMLSILRMFILKDLPELISPEVKIAEVHRCEGIVTSAWWLNFITDNDYRQINTLLSHLIWSIEHDN